MFTVDVSTIGYVGREIYKTEVYYSVIAFVDLYEKSELCKNETHLDVNPV